MLSPALYALGVLGAVGLAVTASAWRTRVREQARQDAHARARGTITRLLNALELADLAFDKVARERADLRDALAHARERADTAEASEEALLAGLVCRHCGELEERAP
ncbi:MAG TPA: hypothetical protein VEA41_16985 [Salinarimonas sp.]|nr:hypothetical protein [Salinarimonas sp.]